MNPEMKQIQERMKNIDMNDPKIQKQYRAQMQALFKKYDCNPMKSLALPFVQMPIFMGMFFGLKGMPEKIPEVRMKSVNGIIHQNENCLTNTHRSSKSEVPKASPPSSVATSPTS